MKTEMQFETVTYSSLLQFLNYRNMIHGIRAVLSKARDGSSS